MKRVCARAIPGVSAARSRAFVCRRSVVLFSQQEEVGGGEETARFVKTTELTRSHGERTDRYDKLLRIYEHIHIYM